MYNKIIKWSIYLLVFLLPIFFLPFSFEAFEFNKQYLLFFLVSSAFLAWLAKIILVDKEIKFKKSYLDLFVLAFLFVAALSAVLSVDKGSSFFGFYGRFSNGFIGLLSLGALYFLITNNVGVKVKIQKSKGKNSSQNSKEEEKDTERQLLSVSKLVNVFLWSVFIVVLFSYFSIFGVWTGIDNILGEKISFPSVMLQATFNPVAGSMESLVVFLAAVLIFLIGRAMVSEKKGGGIINCLLIIAISTLLIVIDFSPAWLMILLSLILFLTVFLWKRTFKDNINKLLLPILFIFLSAVFVFVETSDIQRTVLKYFLPQEQILGQEISWSVGLKSATENIKSGFLGSGPGTFHYGFSKFKPESFNQNIFWQIRFDRPGSHIAEILGTMGFLGLLSYFVLIGMFLFAGYLFLGQNKSGIPLLMLFLVLLMGQFLFYQNTVLSFAFWLVLALLVVNWQKPFGEKIISFKDFPELSLFFSVLFIFLVLVFAGMYFFAVKFYFADMNYKNYFISGEGQKLEKAVNLNPYQSQYKLQIARDYLNKIIIESQKPAEQIDETAFLNNIYLAITYAKGGVVGANVIKGAAELSPNRIAAWETLAMIYRDIRGIAEGSLNWGINSFEKAISLEPTNPVLYTELGKLYLVSGDSDRAEEKFSKAKELKPDYIDALIQLSLLYESQGNLEEAIRQIEGLAGFYPYNIDVLFQLGRLYFNNNQTDKAKASFEAIVALVPNYSNALYSLGIIYQREGQKEKAVASFEKVLEMNPENQDVIQKLKDLREE